MDYIASNKEAWEEAFDHKKEGWGDNNYQRLLNERLPFFEPDVAKELETIDFRGKSVAQFCCNNGRELLSLMQLGAKEGVGFDFAQNIIDQAAQTARKADIRNCRFVTCNVLDIPAEYDNRFDFILFTIGAITWIEDVGALFKKASECLKPGGILFIHDFHPVMNMLAIPGEESFDAEHLDRIAYSYFCKDPWIENEGMDYLSERYASKTFTSFRHTMSDLINAIASNGMRIGKFEEFDYDVGLTEAYDGKGFPLSYLLIATKG